VEADAASSVGFDTQDRRYVRGTLAADAVAPLPGGWSFAARFFGGLAAGLDPTDAVDGLRVDYAPRERMFSLGSGDPLQQMGNPLVRSRGALEETARTSGGGTLPGFNAGVPFPALATLVVEVAPEEWSPRFARSLALRPILFAGAGWAELPPLALGLEPLPAGLDDDEWVQSAGIGIEFGLRTSPVRLRADLPVWVSEPLLASSARDDRGGFRVQLVFDPPRWRR
ncbi:MAG TPA: hypothetical protein VLA43_18505, partial [Longimicrobiales bacterium]|nr:hypothetical protein [Longimicrobiales bacterium]